MTNFAATRMDNILDSHEAALVDPVNNYNVFALLLSATEDGSASSKVDESELTRDGHLAWRALIDWYDSTHMVCATARTLTHKLEHLKLVPGVTPSDYINKFTTYFNQLNRLGGEHTMGPETAKTLFLENMEDPHHEVLVKSLRPHMHTHPLDWLMTELRRDERQDAVKGNTKRHI